MKRQILLSHQKKFNNFIDNVLAHLDLFYGNHGSSSQFSKTSSANFNGGGGSTDAVVPEISQGIDNVDSIDSIDPPVDSLPPPEFPETDSMTLE